VRARRSIPIVQCEVVSVECPQFLVNSRRGACRYETSDGVELAPGHYLALWPAGACLSAYGRTLGYLGPYATAAIAWMLRVSALALGIVRPAAADRDGGNVEPVSGRSSAGFIQSLATERETVGGSEPARHE